jgi:chromate transporter
MQEPVISRLSHRSLFTGFFQAGIMGFGGVLPIARRMIVEERKWMTQAQFNELFALCQFLPGANIVNFAFAYGARQRGLTGAAAAVFGLLAAPVCIVLMLGAAYGRWGGLAAARHGLAGLAAAAAGLVLGTALKIAAPIFVRRSNIALAAVVFGLVVVAHVSLLAAMAVVLPVSLLLAWRAA